MTNDPNPVRGCQGKQRFHTMEKAIKVRELMHKRQPGDMFEAYQCWICKKWHVGHRPYYS